MNFKMCIPCLLGVEGLTADELKQMDAKNVKAENARVFFEGDEHILARANIRSRFGERVLIVMSQFRAKSFEELFQGVKAVNWADYIGKDDTFPVKGYSRNSALHSVPDCQKIIKKAVVEKLKSAYGVSWFEETGPIHQIQFSIVKDEVTIMLDTSGASLHKRGYRPVGNDAPIRETLAASMCSLSRLRHYHTMYDPFCGSGTILIEGALLANNIAPSLKRGFDADRWGLFPDEVWTEERELARSVEKKDTEFIAYGSDIDPRAVELAEINAKRAGVDKFLKLSVNDIKNFRPLSETGTLITNPPYGKRMLDVNEARGLYKIMGRKFRPRHGWSYGIISPDESFENFYGAKADKKRKLYNGMIKCNYYMYYKNK